MDGTIAQLDKIRVLCDRYDALLGIDECHASGFLGQTGRGTHEYRGVFGKIDIITGTLGKALGGGVIPISAICASSEVLGVFKPGDHGSTFGGNPLACAVARAAMKAIKDEGLAANESTLKMIHADCIKMFEMLKERKHLK